jgi:predicted transcriptional regulator
MIERVAEIVAAYVKRNSVAPDQVPGLIQQVNQALTGLGQPQEPPPPAMPDAPAVPIRRSVTPDKIICLDCGYKGQMLKRHLTTAHGLSVDEYRTRWNLHSDYPMIAPNYSVRRSELAKSFGLGIRNSRKTRAK